MLDSSIDPSSPQVMQQEHFHPILGGTVPPTKKRITRGTKRRLFFSRTHFFTVHGRSDEVRRLHRTGSRAALEFCPSVLSVAAHFLVFVCNYMETTSSSALQYFNHPPPCPSGG
ncbi:hypothetical protein CEXT_672431 [Caerostris extrusa]|uniref:Uncharacterized protein n=1 Tax=Caerostris extrusa TaxID=172846 RepID=A0AAV4P115_CAEEX|nr:hypothetical protein CEXT_672431 [Caerostris extrusa]